MLKNCVKLYYKSQTVNYGMKVISRAQSTSEKWDLIAATCIERKPVVTPEPNDLEKKFQLYLNEIEFEKSMKSDHEIRHEDEVKFAEILKKGDSLDLDLDVSSKQTAQDMEDASIDELNKFTFASRITEADKKNDITSLQRKLDRHLVLLVEQSLGSKNHFLFPQTRHKEGETMKQAAERALTETCGENIKAKIWGNAPAGFYKYKYPQNARNESVGAKVFMYVAQHLEGQIDNKDVKYKWLDRQELQKELPSEYYQRVSQFLIDEAPVTVTK